MLRCAALYSLLWSFENYNNLVLRPLPPRGGLGTRLRTTDAKQYVKHLLLSVLLVCTLLPLQDTPGFIVNRLLVPYMAEAVRMLERGA